MNPFEGLIGAQVQRIDGPRPDLFAFTLHRPGETGVLMVALLETGAEWGWVERRPRGEPASAFVQQLRKHLENTRVRAVVSHAHGSMLEVSRGHGPSRVHLSARPANLLLEVDGKVVGAADPATLRRQEIRIGDPGPAQPEGPAAMAASLEALTERGPALVERVLTSAIVDRRHSMRRALRRLLKKLRRRLVAIEGDLERVDRVAGLRGHADLLLAHLHEIPEGASEATLTDWTTSEPVTIPIGAGRSARTQAEQLYRKARKLERGGRFALERHELTETEIAHAEGLLERINDATDPSLDEIEAAMRKLGVRPVRSGAGRRAAPPARSPYRTFHGHGERAILVGRTAADNDRLTLGARPWDLWLHARGVRGSHVIIPLTKRETCPDALLLDAAHLAAHFSSARGESTIDVQYCDRRHVRKPRGFPAGAVRVEREKVLGLRIEAARLSRLLSNEVH